jgi:CubicO group peptidase (beta-lactamase class C family)
LTADFPFAWPGCRTPSNVDSPAAFTCPTDGLPVPGKDGIRKAPFLQQPQSKRHGRGRGIGNRVQNGRIVPAFQVGQSAKDGPKGDDPEKATHGISFSARDRAKFGQLYLNNGEYEGKQVLSADWVRDSLQRYSEGINVSGWMPGITSRYGYFRDLGYGYQWWSARAGDHHFNYASGHGGNLIVLLDELDMVIVTSADPLHFQFGGEAWDKEKAIVDLVGKFINSLPQA